jgi:rhodanese-related sulfurtransferase
MQNVKKFIYSTLTLSLLSMNLMAYDANKAEEFSKFYAHMTQKACADSKLFMPADKVMKMLRDKKDFVMLDVRTDGENSVLALSGENALHIPINVLFEKENLDKLPADKTLVVVCHSGTRATLAAVGLKRLGFKKVHVLKGGMVALAKANNPKNAPMK